MARAREGWRYELCGRQNPDTTDVMEDLMISGKSQLVQRPLVVITLVLVLGALSMIWPAIITLFLGVVLLLLQTLGGELAVVVLP